ncbi:MAG: hypothetical protein PHN31_03185 [Candidatus Gracilibacteria bacterium]|nr:hypothetical protein [Candidatus Gracilibacteria bacterium]
MKIIKTGSTIVEVMISLFIISTGVIGVYSIYVKSQNLSKSTENRVKALSIAREGIEVIQNIRDTNWIPFSADTKNCWNTLNYNITCIGNIGTSGKISSGSYTIEKDTINNRWLLRVRTQTGEYNLSSYRSAYKVYIDDEGFYTQSGGNLFLPRFTRQLNISYPYGPYYNARDQKMLIKSVVSRSDSSKRGFSSIELENMLTNWKEN